MALQELSVPLSPLPDSSLAWGSPQGARGATAVTCSHEEGAQREERYSSQRGFRGYL